VFQSAPDLIRALLPGSATASTACFCPVVLLEAQTYRFLQQQPQVEHWAVLV
jgi:hypothetical protein